VLHRARGRSDGESSGPLPSALGPSLSQRPPTHVRRRLRSLCPRLSWVWVSWISLHQWVMQTRRPPRNSLRMARRGGCYWEAPPSRDTSRGAIPKTPLLPAGENVGPLPSRGRRWRFTAVLYGIDPEKVPRHVSASELPQWAPKKLASTMPNSVLNPNLSVVCQAAATKTWSDSSADTDDFAERRFRKDTRCFGSKPSNVACGATTGHITPSDHWAKTNFADFVLATGVRANRQISETSSSETGQKGVRSESCSSACGFDVCHSWCGYRWQSDDYVVWSPTYTWGKDITSGHHYRREDYRTWRWL